MNDIIKNHSQINIWGVTANEITTSYNITDLHSSLQFIFTAYIMDLYGNIKDKDKVIFCELIIILF